MKILIASDSHDSWTNLEKTILSAQERGCEVFLFAGDLIAPPGIKILREFPGKVHAVLGNNEGEIAGLTRAADASENVMLYTADGSYMEETIDGLDFYMNHYPGIVRNAAMSGKYNVCVYGHDHTYHEEKLGNDTILLNPGFLKGSESIPATCMVFDTTTKAVERISL